MDISQIEKKIDQAEKKMGQLQNQFEKLVPLPNLIEDLKEQYLIVFRALDDLRVLVSEIRIELAGKRDKDDCDRTHDRVMQLNKDVPISSNERWSYIELIKLLVVGLTAAVSAVLGNNFLAG